MLKITRVGMYITVQDSDRHGSRQSGIGRCGTSDMPVLCVANLPVDNGTNVLALEVTLGQLTAELETDRWSALMGTDCETRLDDNVVWTGW